MAVIAFGEWFLSLIAAGAKLAKKAPKAFATHRWVVVPVAGIVLVILASCTGSSNKADSTPSPSASASAKAMPSVTKTTPAPKRVDTSVLEGVVKKALKAVGFKDNQYKLGPVRKDTTPAGNDVFSSKPLLSGKDVSDFLKSGTAQARAVMAAAMKDTGATREELENPDNWVTVQFKVPVRWGGNTFYRNGKIVSASSAKNDNAGTVAQVFVPPRQVAAGKVTSVFTQRGACANPQTLFPVPAPPTPTVVPPPSHYVPPPAAKPPVTPTPPPCTQPWYAGLKGYRQISPCVWIKDLVKNTYDCQQNWRSGCPGTGGWVQPPQKQTTAQSSATAQPTTVPTTAPAPSSAPTTSVVTGTPIVGSTATPTSNPTTCPFGQTSC